MGDGRMLFNPHLLLHYIVFPSRGLGSGDG